MIKGIKGVFIWGRWNTRIVLRMLLLVTLSSAFFIKVGNPDAAEEKLPDAAVILDKHVGRHGQTIGPEDAGAGHESPRHR